MSKITVEFTETTEALPVREDGSAWPFAMVSQGTATFAETRSELVEMIVEDYAAIEDPAKALIARYQQSVALANMAQAAAAANATDQGTFDLATETEDDINAIFADRSGSLSLPASWSNAVPLILVATDYEPYTATPAPTGNVLLIDPYSDTTFLDSLRDTGLIELYVTSDEDSDETEAESNVVPLHS